MKRILLLLTALIGFTSFGQSTYLPGFGSWKAPVANLAALPSVGNQIGDARVTKNTSVIYVWNGSAWVAAGGGGGSVTSVGLSLPADFTVSGSPVTTSGTLSASYASQTQNKVLASPNGSSGTPSFRALAAADIPSLSSTYLPLSGGTMSGNITLAGNATSALQPVTLNQLNAAILGFTPKGSVHAATTASDGNKALTGSVTADGQSVPNNDLVLLQFQTDPIENGIWVVNTGGAWSRPANFSNGADCDGTYVSVLNGATYGAQLRQQIGSPCIVGTDGESWDFLSQTVYTADEVTLTLSGGNTFSVKNGGISNAQVNASAGINFSKLEATNPDSIAFFDSSGYLQSRVAGPNLVMATDLNGAPSVVSITATELYYAAVGATAPGVQNQLAGKEPTITATTSADYYRGDKTFQPLSSAVRAELSATAPVQYNSSTGVISMTQAGASTDGWIDSADWNGFNDKMGNPFTTLGDMVMSDASNFPIRLGVGSAGQFLGVASGIPTWQTPVATSPMAYNAGTHTWSMSQAGAVLDGYLLSADWNNFNSKMADPTTTAGDLIRRNSSNVLGRLPIGSSGQVLTVNTGEAVWQSLPTYTASRVLVSDGSGVPSASSVTSTTLGFLDATSSIQTQLNGKQAGPLTGDVTTSGAAATLATVNSNVGSFTRANITVNGKGLITAASNGAAVNLASEVTGVLPIANGGTNNSSAYTAGSIVFSSGTALTQDNANLFFDDANNRLRVNNASSTAGLIVSPSATTDAGIVSKAIAAMTGKLQEWQSSAGAVLASIDVLGNLTIPHLIGNATTGTITGGTGAGTGPTISRTGTDLAGQINVTTGTAPAANSTIVTLNWSTTLTSAPRCVLSPANALTARIAVNASPFTTQSTTALTLTSNNTALNAAQALRWYYVCAQ